MNILFFQLQHRWCLRANLSSSLKIKHENRNQRQAESMYKFDRWSRSVSFLYIKVYRTIQLFVKAKKRSEGSSENGDAVFYRNDWAAGVEFIPVYL